MHEKASEAYDAKMTETLAHVHDMPAVKVPGYDNSPSADEAHIVRTFGPGDIRMASFRMFLPDYTGENTACYFYAAGRMVGLDGEGHKMLVAAVRRIANDRDYRAFLSEEYVYTAAINWLQAKTDATPTTPERFTEFLTARAASDIRDCEFWFPIPALQVDVEFTIGAATFRRITKEMMDDLAARTDVDRSPEQKFSFDRERASLQSAAAACVHVHAEPIQARQSAEQVSELSIAMLRLACPAIFNVHQWAPLHPDFMGHAGTATAVQVEDGKIVGIRRGLDPRMLGQWRITQTELDRQTKRLWKFAHALLTKERNDFQQTLLGVLVQYSKSLLKSDLAERLLYVISALETLFVSAGEPIGQTLRERMATLKDPPASNRTEFMRLVSHVYEHRSAFVHRGEALEDVQILEAFLIDAWATLTFALNNHDKWRTKAEFHAALDAHKFSGPTFSTRGLPPV